MMFVNYPLVKNLYSKNLIPKTIDQINTSEMALRISELIFSQNNVGICNDIFWKQS
jgi:hypothetical protein